jgi:urea transport system substrate-binding protein
MSDATPASRGGRALARAAVVIAAVFALAAIGLFVDCSGRASGGIRVGVLHSLSGTMAISERAVVEATLVAIEEVNAAGGLLGRRIEPVVRDGQSDGTVFAREAEQLITVDKVVTTFGCWTSASRKQVKPVVERHGHLLFYPVQYEGLEQSPSIVYTGAAPNQQIIPAVTWSFEHLGRRFFLVGSDYVFPHTANAIIRPVVEALGGEVVGEAYALLGSRDMGAIIDRIERARPDVILNTINGDSNVAFFQELRQAGISSAEIPTVSFSIGETELSTIGAENLVGDYAAWNYFQSLESAENRSFVDGLRRRLGPAAVASDPMEAAYLGVHLWALSVQEAGSTEVPAVLEALADQSFPAPEGVVYVDAVTRHTWKTVRIGRIRPDGQFDVVWSSRRPVRPTPFPVYRSHAEWEIFLAALAGRWGGHWANPGEPPGRTRP